MDDCFFVYTRKYIKELLRLNQVFEFLLDGLLIRTCRTRARKYSTLRRQPQLQIIFFFFFKKKKKGKCKRVFCLLFTVYILIWTRVARAHVQVGKVRSMTSLGRPDRGAPEGRRDTTIMKTLRILNCPFPFTFLLLFLWLYNPTMNGSQSEQPLLRNGGCFSSFLSLLIRREENNLIPS